MINKLSFLLLFSLVSLWSLSQTLQQGPYTVNILADGVYHIEDANDSNPAGEHLDEDGNMVGQNNCSDMYFVVGKDKALLIDLSNAVTWDSTAAESLRSVVYERLGNKELFITVTHKHGDHLGMLPAFADDPQAKFWLPKAEFKDMDVFPKSRTSYFAENNSIDLGGDFVINTMEVPGHTEHSTLFFLKNMNMAFSGDAIGSGSGIWLFNEESFFTYKKGIEALIQYIENSNSNIDLQKLVFHGGHAWQSKQLEKLTVQYVYDMQTLIERMAIGEVETEEMSTFISFLDTSFKYGTATISWNKEAAAKYANSSLSK